MILDSPRNRRAATRRAVLAGIVFLLLAGIPLAMLRLTAQAADPPEKSAAENTSDTQKTADKKQTDEAAFGKVIERVVQDERQGRKFLIDLDTGKMSPLTEEVKKLNNQDTIKWMRKQGIDAMPEWGDGLYGFAMIARPVDGLVADKSLDDLPMPTATRLLKDLVEFGDPGTPMLMTARREKLPETFLFVTSDGGQGVLKIVEFTDNPRGMKIRYRLLKGGRAAKITPDADGGPSSARAGDTIPTLGERSSHSARTARHAGRGTKPLP